MQNISTTLDTAIKEDAHRVLPSVQADWVSGRSLQNVKAYSTADDYSEFINGLSPVSYHRLNESFDYGKLVNTGVKPVSHWRMNNSSTVLGTGSAPYSVYIQDEIGYNNLVMNSSAIPGTDYLLAQPGVVQDDSGNIGSSIKLQNVANSYATSVNPDLDNKWTIADNPNFTFECWIKPMTLSANFYNIIAFKTGMRSAYQSFNLEMAEWTLMIDGTDGVNMFPRFTIMNDSGNLSSPLSTGLNVYMDVKSSVSVATNLWYHVVVTYNTKELNMYINNVLVGTTSTTNGTIAQVATGTLYVGTNFLSRFIGSSTSYLGYIDELAIYNECLSMADVERRWRSGSLNIGFPATRLYTDNIYRNVYDYSTKGRNGFIANPAGVNFQPSLVSSTFSPISGRRDGGSYKFLNRTTGIECGYLTSDNTATGTSVFDGSNNLTVSAWVYVTAANTTGAETIEMIAALGQDSDNNGYADNGTAASNAWYLTLRKQPSSGPVLVSASINNSGTNPIATTSTGLTLNQWHHIVMSVDSLNRVVLMVNGNYTTPAASTSSTTTMNINPAWKLFIGARQSTEACRDTYISEVAVFNVKADLRVWSSIYKSAVATNNFKNLNKFYDPLQVVNGQYEHTVTWAVLDAIDERGNIITADGNYYLAEHPDKLNETDYEYGWWSKAKSDGSGNFATPQSIYLTFDPVYANYIDLYSSTKYGPIKSGTFYYQLENGTWSSAIAFTVDSAGKYVYSIGSAPKIKALQLFINSTLYPNDVARVQEFAPRFSEDISDYVVSMEISKTRENNDSSVPLGATAANTCNLTLDNTLEGRFNPGNTGSDLYGLITPGIKFTTGYNYITTAGTEYIKQGTFYSDNWSVQTDNMTVSVQCRDFSARMQDNAIVDGYIANDVTASEAIGELAVRSGVPLSKLNIDYNYVKRILNDNPDAYWRFNETKLEPFTLNFDGKIYLYSHPFADLLMDPASATHIGVKKNTTYAARTVLPRTFYDFPNSELTLEFWVKCATPASEKTIMAYATKRFASEFKVSVNTLGQIVTRLQTYAPGSAEAAGISSTYVVADNMWHHVAVVIDPASASGVTNTAQVTYYIDGNLDNTGTISNFDTFRPSGQMLIGAGFTASTYSAPLATGPHTLNSNTIFTGYLKEIKIWGNSRTQSQIRQYMNNPMFSSRKGAHSANVYKNVITSAAPVAYYPLDIKVNSSSTGLLVRDISGFDRNAPLTSNGFTSVDGPIVSEDSSRGLKFKAANTTSYVSVSNSSITPFEGTTDGNTAYDGWDLSIFPNYLSRNANFTVECWFKPQSAALMPIVTKTAAANADREWALQFNANSTISFIVYEVATGTAAVTVPSDLSLALTLGSWNHIAATVDGSKIQVFVNGKYAGSGYIPTGSYIATALPGKPAAPLRIGQSVLGSTTYLSDAALSHVAIYKRTLSLQELYLHYTKAGYGTYAAPSSSEGRLLYYWPLNQGRFYQYEDFKQSGFAYKYASRNKQNIVPNMTKFTNHMYAYTSNSLTTNLTSAKITSSLWKSSGLLAVKDYAKDKNYLTYRMGTSAGGYNETDSTNQLTFNFDSPISSEVERSIKFTSSKQHVAYMNHSADLPMTISASTSFSLEMWLKPTTFTNKQYIFARENFGSTVAVGAWRLFVDIDGKVKFEIYPTAGGAALVITPTTYPAYSTLTLNTWQHVAAVFSISGANSICDLFVNGQSYARYTWATATVALTSSEVKTIIGGYQNPSPPAGTTQFDGYISNVAIYNRALVAGDFLSHYARGISIRQQTYTGIATSADSYWAEMLKIATADIGMFFFDEDGYFVYEHGRSYDDAIDSQHAVVQYEINDGNSGSATSNKALISASQTVELQTNKVIVKVYPPIQSGTSTNQIWAANSGESLAICKLANALSAVTTNTMSLSLTLNPAGEYEPVWPLSGIVKIDDEFIKYNKSSGNALFDLERGYWNTTPANHAAGAVVGEAREYNLEWSNQPVFFVKYPFMTAVQFDRTVVASNWRFDGQKGYIRLYPSSSALVSNKYIVLEGNNPVTKLDNYFHVAGFGVESSNKGTQNIVEVSNDYKDNIRRYGEKVLEIDNPLIQDASYAKDLAQYILSKYANPVPILEVKTMGIPHLQLGDRIKINTLDRMSLIDAEYWITSISLSYNGAIDQSMTLRRVS